ncbi:MAG: hypothetical protein LBO04_02530 [Spirochaetaceae bacterium]|jgi:hypothetical protein|nr:hypothetical protein [Spirochaetaceae bacterium]
MEGHPLILAARDTTSVNYNSQQKMEGNGYIGGNTMGGNIHSALAVSPDGLALGVLDQERFKRAGSKNTALNRERRKNRPTVENGSNLWPGTTGNADRDIGNALKTPRARDREGDNYELFDKGYNAGGIFSYG